MEKNYNTENFEHLLRQTTDQFRMYPSRRVWHGLYNDLHPGKKWPSFAVLLLLITSIMYVGITNPDQPDTGATVITKGSKPEIASNVVSDVAEVFSKNDSYPVSFGVVSDAASKTRAQRQNSTGTNSGGLYIASMNTEYSDNTTSKTDNPAARLNSSNISFNADERVSSVDKQRPQNNNTIAEKTNSIVNEQTKSSTTDVVISKETSTSFEITTPSLETQPDAMFAKTNLKNEIAKPKASLITALENDKEWIEDFVLHNKKPFAKWKNRTSYQVYVTPSVGYRSIEKNTSYSAPAATSLVTNPNQNSMDYSFNHASAINLEAGTMVLLNWTKALRLKAGIQLNYTNYRILANKLNHPTSTTLMLNDLDNGYPVLSARSTIVANTPGPSAENLDNNTYQISLPVGADFKIAGKDKFKWYAGATIQPTYVAGGNSYLISSDMKNYVAGDNFMRKFNLNGAIETFVSFRTPSGMTLSAGPQFRYQFMSTYSKVYTYDEKLYNLGVKLSMTTNF